MDEGAFDLFCEHLVLEDRSQRQIVGTYRMQSREVTAQDPGYYSQQEFDFASCERLRGELLEACRGHIGLEHQTSKVLTHLR